MVCLFSFGGGFLNNYIILKYGDEIGCDVNKDLIIVEFSGV